MSIFRRGAWKQVILGGGKSEWLLLMNDFRHHSFACCLFIHCYQLHIDYTCIWHMNDFNRLWLAGNWLTNTTDSQYQWLPDWLINWLIAWLIDWLIDGWTDRQSDWLTIQNDWMTLELTDWLDRRDDILTYSISSASMWLYSNSSVFDTSVGSINNSTSFNWSIVRFCTYSWVM